MSYISNLLAKRAKTTEPTAPVESIPEPELEAAPDPTPEEAAKALFPEPVAAYENANIHFAESFVAYRTRLVNPDNKAVKAVSDGLFKEREAITNDYKGETGDLRTYTLAHPVPSLRETVELTGDDLRDLGITKEAMEAVNEDREARGQKPLGWEFDRDIHVSFVFVDALVAALEAEPEPVDTCNGTFQSGKRAGEACTAAAKEHGYCGMHQSQAADEWQPKADATPEPEAESAPESETDLSAVDGDKLETIGKMLEAGFSKDEIVNLLG